MQVISLSPVDLSIAALLVIGLAVLSVPMKLQLSRQLLVAGSRTVLQLSLVGLVLKALFDHAHPAALAAVAAVMVGVAGVEIMKRQKRRFAGAWGIGVGTLSMFVSSFCVTILALTVVIDIRPWYHPQYAIPLLGMILGNTMSGISVGLDRLTATAWDQRTVIEARLILGHGWSEAIEAIRRESIRSGLIPIINSMSVVGLVSLPGMMTGQILAGSPPMEAAKYQLMIMFLIAAGTGLGSVAAVWIGARRLFDKRDRLRLERLRAV